MKRPAYLEIVVVAGVLGTFGLCAVKLASSGHRDAPREKTVLVVDAGAVEPAPPPLAAPRSSLADILAKLQKGQPLTIDEQRELDRLARENGSGAAMATALDEPAPDAEPDPKTVAKKKSPKPERRMAAFGDMPPADIVASLKGAGKPEEKSDAFVRAAFPNLTAEQQRAISAGIVKKAASSKKESAAPVALPGQD